MPYTIYTTEFDETIRPRNIVSDQELKDLSKSFHALCPVENFAPLRDRLAQLKAPVTPSVITFLIDNSGSMKGPSIRYAIGAVGIMAMYLDRLGVRNEILGFTTKEWRGGESRLKWINEGRPQNPGRLNDLCHVIYKDIDEPIDTVRDNLGLMLLDGFLRENIDGEAVQWACSRLRSYSEQRKILFVISDGAPLDDATIDANPISSNYVSDHLTEVIAELTKAGDIVLDAIGIRHDVSAFYGVGDCVDTVGDLAPVAIAKLETILNGGDQS